MSKQEEEIRNHPDMQQYLVQMTEKDTGILRYVPLTEEEHAMCMNALNSSGDVSTIELFNKLHPVAKKFLFGIADSGERFILIMRTEVQMASTYKVFADYELRFMLSMIEYMRREVPEYVSYQVAPECTGSIQ